MSDVSYRLYFIAGDVTFDLKRLDEERSMMQASVDNLRATLADMQQSR